MFINEKDIEVKETVIIYVWSEEGQSTHTTVAPAPTIVEGSMDRFIHLFIYFKYNNNNNNKSIDSNKIKSRIIDGSQIDATSCPLMTKLNDDQHKLLDLLRDKVSYFTNRIKNLIYLTFFYVLDSTFFLFLNLP